jgi:hypothetical protein
VQNAAVPTDTEKAAIEAEIAKLIAEDAILSAREKAVKQLKEKKRARLLVLMKQLGYTRRQTAEGTASIGESVSYEVKDHSKLQEMFAADMLVQQVKIDKAFWEAAKKAHVNIDSAVTPVPGSRFKVAARQTKDAKERQQRIIDETKYEMEQRVERLARQMMEFNVRSE